MPGRSKRTIAEQLNSAQIAISNSLGDTEIQELVSAYGYTPEKLNEGKTLYEGALVAVNSQTKFTGSQQQATEDLVKAEKIAFDAYQALAKVARAIFSKDKAKLVQLGIDGTMPRNTASFLRAAYTIFDNAGNISEIKTALASYGYTDEKITSERQKIAAYDTANQLQESSKGAAQQSTQDQKHALSLMNDWVSQYIKIAKVALRDKKQLLEKIGVLSRTSKTAAQKSAAKKA